MDIFEYAPIDLEGPTFRLLRLFRGRELGGDGSIEYESDIECELFQAWLHGDAVMPYEALSYTWGGMELTKYIRIDGRRLYVTENLYCALQHLRSRDTDKILWIDAVCIN